MKQAKSQGLSFTLIVLSLIFFLFFVKDSSAFSLTESFGSMNFTYNGATSPKLDLVEIVSDNIKLSDMTSYNGDLDWYLSIEDYDTPIVKTDCTTKVNTCTGILFDLDSSGIGDNRNYGGIVYITNESFTLNDDFYLDFYNYYSTGAWVLWNTDNSGLIIGSDSTTAYLSEVGGSWVSGYGCFVGGDSLVHSNISKNNLQGQISEYCNFTDYNLSQNFIALGYFVYATNVLPSQNNGYIDDIGIYNVTYVGNNQLPNVTLTYNSSLFCFNESKGYVDFTFDLNVVDPESDTIYYSTQQNKVLNNSYVLDFTNHYCVLGLCADYKDTSFLDDLIDSNFTDDSFLVYDLYTGMEPNEYELIFLDNMVFNYELEKALLNLNSIIEFGNLFDGNNFNISYSDSTLENDFMNLYVIRNISNIDVMVQDEVVFTFAYNTTTNYLDIFYYNNSLFYLANDETNSGFIAWELEDNTPTVISIDSQDLVDTTNSFRLRSIEYFGNSFDFEWTTSQPTNKIYWDVGEYVYNVYVTDYVHKDIPDYVHKSVYVKIVDEDQCIEPYGQTNLITQITSKTVGQFIKDMGMGNTVESMLSLAYLICLVLGFIVLGSFSTSFFLTNLSFFFLSLLLGLSFGPLIIFSVLLAISTMNFFKEVF